MPITQNRMIDLIDAVDAVLKANTERRRLVTGVYKAEQAIDGRITQARELISAKEATLDTARQAAVLYEEVINALKDCALSDGFETIHEAMRVVEHEKAHFQYHRKANDRNRHHSATYRARQRSAQDTNIQTLFGPDPSLNIVAKHSNSETVQGDCPITETEALPDTTAEDARRARQIAERLNAAQGPTLFDKTSS